MKTKTIILVFVSMLFAFSAFSQKVMFAEKEYKIKGDKIYFEGKDVSHLFSEEDRVAIFQKLETLKEKRKEDKKEAKELKKEEKKIQKEEKEQKKKENDLDNYDDSVDKLEKAQAKFERLKRKGKLSPNDEVKWLDKIAKLKEKMNSKKKKLK